LKLNLNNITDEKHTKIIYSDSFELHNKTVSRFKGASESFAKINAFFLDYIAGYNIPTAFQSINKDTLNFAPHTQLSVNLKIANIVDKRSAKIFSIRENENLLIPLIQAFNGENENDVISESHIISFDLLSVADFKVMNRFATKINAVLKSFFERRDLILAEFICNFGKSDDKTLLIGDFSPASIKILSPDNKLLPVNIYKITTAQMFKTYTEFILDLIKS
jgi:phosphoribosylaminoimidazole-succinocarboxamide synthase